MEVDDDGIVTVSTTIRKTWQETIQELLREEKGATELYNYLVILKLILQVQQDLEELLSLKELDV